MSKFMKDLERVISPSENVTIERIRQEVDCDNRRAAASVEQQQDEQPQSLPFRSVKLPVDFPVLPMLNRDEFRLREVATFSMVTNVPLNCRWHYYVKRLPDDATEINTTHKSDYKFRSNLLRYCGDEPPPELRMKLKFIPSPKEGGKMTPSPTAPARIRHTVPEVYLKRRSKAFIGLGAQKPPACCPQWKGFGIFE